MSKNLKYLISLFLAFVVIAGDGAFISQSKSAEYYQSSFVILREELDFKKSRFFNQFISRVKFTFLIPVIYLEFKQVCSFQVQIVLKLRTLLHQNINSFIRQAVFVNETFTSSNFHKSLYSA